MMFHKILCPTDFSEASYHGLKIAAEMAQQNNAELCVLHVEAPLGAMPLPTSHIPYAQSDAARSAEVVANLCRVIEERMPSTAHSHPVLKRGQAAEEIARAAREENADLIVLTTHGASGLRPGELGSVAERVLQSAPCPVLAVSGMTGAPAARSEQNGTDVSGALRSNIELPSSKKIFLDGD